MTGAPSTAPLLVVGVRVGSSEPTMKYNSVVTEITQHVFVCIYNNHYQNYLLFNLLLFKVCFSEMVW